MKITVLNYELKESVQNKIQAMNEKYEKDKELHRLMTDEELDPPVYVSKDDDYVMTELEFYPEPSKIDYILENMDGNSEVKMGSETFLIKEKASEVYTMKMKHLLGVFIFLICSSFSSAQLPYTWNTGVNPGWVSSNGVLDYQAGCNVVTTNCNGNYTNNTNSVYTSGLINGFCPSASTVAFNFTASGNAEYGYDFLFIFYSIDGGTTWVNPYGINEVETGNFGGGMTIPNVIIPVSTSLMIRFQFTSDGTVRESGYKISDVNITCNNALPVELISFTGEKGNALKWITSDEVNNDYYTLKRSVDGYDWVNVSVVKSKGSGTYICQDNFYSKGKVNYYELFQTDLDGTYLSLEIVAIDNTSKDREIVGIYNLLGQPANEYATGVLINQYSDGTTERFYRRD